MRAMKNSGIEWLGKIPESWGIKELKYACEIYTGDSIKDDEKDLYTDPENAIPYISTKDIDLDTRRIDYENGLYIPVTNKKFKLAPKHSFLLCIEGGSAGKKIAFTDRDVNFVNKLCCFKSNKNTDSKFMYFYCQSDAFLSDFYLNMTGLIGGVSQNILKSIRIATPSITEQKAIADYLDHECAKIDNAVEKQRIMIEKLKEYKKSVITEAVTNGLNPDVKMKDSGIEWIGKIPEHWEVRRIKTLGEYRNGLTYNPENMVDEEEGILVLRSSNVQNGKLVFEDNVFVNSEIPDQLLVQKGDIIICSRNGSRELVGKNAIVKEDLRASFGAFMMVFRSQYPEYMNYILNSAIFSYYLSSFFTSTINQLTGGNFGNMRIVFCPNDKERAEIIAYLDQKCAKIDSTVAKLEKMVDLLLEQKKAFIYEFVSGKKEICSAKL